MSKKWKSFLMTKSIKKILSNVFVLCILFFCQKSTVRSKLISLETRFSTQFWMSLLNKIVSLRVPTMKIIVKIILNGFSSAVPKTKNFVLHSTKYKEYSTLCTNGHFNNSEYTENTEYMFELLFAFVPYANIKWIFSWPIMRSRSLIVLLLASWMKWNNHFQHD